jgi:hypothetical protein
MRCDAVFEDVRAGGRAGLRVFFKGQDRTFQDWRAGWNGFRAAILILAGLAAQWPGGGNRCTIYIMRRTQLYLEDDLWSALHARARREQTTISELVRRAAREQYLHGVEDRQAVMAAFAGSRAAQHDTQDSTEYVREMRRGNRLARLER